MSFPWGRATLSPLVRILIFVFTVFVFSFAVRAYQSERLLVLAEGGRKTIQDYELLLTDSINSNPWNGPARLRLADLKLSQQDYPQTVKQLQTASPGRNHWKGWERLGAVYERMAFQPDGTDVEIQRAVDFYDRVLKVYPTYERGLERRSVLALKLGEWSEIEDYASRLQELDANNRNVIYMRGRAAEATGHTDIAFHLYTQLSAGNRSSTGTLFTHKDIIERLSSLSKSGTE